MTTRPIMPSNLSCTKLETKQIALLSRSSMGWRSRQVPYRLMGSRQVPYRLMGSRQAVGSKYHRSCIDRSSQARRSFRFRSLACPAEARPAPSAEAILAEARPALPAEAHREAK